MKMSEITRKNLLQIPKRKWNEVLHNVNAVYIIPSRRKHDSGYACMEFVAVFKGGREMIRFGGGCDSVSLEGQHFNMECMYPSGIISIWNDRGFSVSDDVSTIWFREYVK